MGCAQIMDARTYPEANRLDYASKNATNADGHACATDGTRDAFGGGAYLAETAELTDGSW